MSMQSASVLEKTLLPNDVNPVLELEIKYPAGVTQREVKRGYMFRLALEQTVNEADRTSSVFSDDIDTDEIMVLADRTTKWLHWIIPAQVANEAPDDKCK